MKVLCMHVQLEQLLETFTSSIFINKIKRSVMTMGFFEFTGGGTPLTLEEEQEIAYLCRTNSFFKETKGIVEDFVRAESLKRGEEATPYFFKLDNADYPYTIDDMPLVTPSCVRGDLEVEIMKFHSVSNVVARPCTAHFREMQEATSGGISHWISSNKSADVIQGSVRFAPSKDEMCLVKWPRWEEVTYIMEGEKKDWWKPNMDDLLLDIFSVDYEQHAGKWFRASCKYAYCDDNNDKESARMFEMFLVDIGKTTLIPAKYILRMPHRFMLNYQTSLTLSFVLDGITQFSTEVDEKWKYLLLPGMRVKVNVLWMFDEICIVKLVWPTELQFDKHFLHAQVQTRINLWKQQVQSNQRHRRVKKMSRKGEYMKNMDKVLAEEAQEKKLQPLKDEYSGIGRVQFERVFELCIPSPVPQ